MTRREIIKRRINKRQRMFHEGTRDREPVAPPTIAFPGRVGMGTVLIGGLLLGVLIVAALVLLMGCDEGTVKNPYLTTDDLETIVDDLETSLDEAIDQVLAQFIADEEEKETENSKAHQPQIIAANTLSTISPEESSGANPGVEVKNRNEQATTVTSENKFTFVITIDLNQGGQEQEQTAEPTTEAVAEAAAEAGASAEQSNGQEIPDEQKNDQSGNDK